MNESTDSEENTGDREPHGGPSSGGAFEAPTEGQVAHPYLSDDSYRRFADELDWGLI